MEKSSNRDGLISQWVFAYLGKWPRITPSVANTQRLTPYHSERSTLRKNSISTSFGIADKFAFNTQGISRPTRFLDDAERQYLCDPESRPDRLTRNR